MRLVHTIENAGTAIGNPRMLIKWLRWELKYFGLEAKLTIDSETHISGFSSFSDYWSAVSLMPSQQERAFIARYVESQGIIIDVGANLGVFSAVLARLRPGATIHAFEPAPATFARLVENTRRNGLLQAQCHAVACGAMSGSLRFVANSHSPATNRFFHECIDAGRKDHVEVPVITLDEFSELSGIKSVSFLKIDVEGFESDVLRGCVRLFAEKRVALGLVEVCPGNLLRLGRTVSDFMRSIHDADCEIRKIESDGRIGGIMKEDEVESVSLTNAALIPRFRLDELLGQQP